MDLEFPAIFFHHCHDLFHHLCVCAHACVCVCVCVCACVRVCVCVCASSYFHYYNIEEKQIAIVPQTYLCMSARMNGQPLGRGEVGVTLQRHSLVQMVLYVFKFRQIYIHTKRCFSPVYYRGPKHNT